jgi:hypothetical protein
LLLLLAAVDADRLAAGEGGQAPDPGEAAERARELAAENHLGDDVAALAAVFLGDADAVEARLGELVPQREGILVLVALELARPALGHLGVDPAPHRVAKGAMFL